LSAGTTPATRCTMPDIGTVVFAYQTAYEQAQIVDSPVLWCAHYRADGDLLGYLSYPEIRGDHHMTIVVQGLLGPFKSPDVASSFIITHLTQPNDPRVLFVSALVDRPEKITAEHWQVPVSVSDRGGLLTGVPERTLTVPSGVNKALGSVGGTKRDGSTMTLTFDDAMSWSVFQLKQVDEWTH